MQITTNYEITDIKEENAEGTKFSATINGTRWQGIDELSPRWTPLQEAITEGASVTPFSVDPIELLGKTDMELVKLAARQLEDDLVAKDAAGELTPSETTDKIRSKIAERQALREQI